MKGLLIKDFKLLKGQKNFFVSIVVLAIVMGMYVKDSSFIIGYMTFAGSLFSLSTISYDEFDNGNAFLFSLPISRRNYIVEKYVFGLILGGTSWLFATIIAAITGLSKNSIMIKDTMMIALSMLPILIIVLTVMLPLQFKFGGEKSRIAIFAVVGLMCGIAFVVVKVAGLFNIDLITMFNNLPTMSMGELITVFLGIAIIVFLISLKISVSIMNRKEF